MNVIFIGLFLLLFLSPMQTGAGTFQVIPTTLSIDTKSKVGAFQVRNDGEEKVTIQLDVKEWRQDEKGADQYLSTKDVVFFPKIMTLEKAEERIVRVGYQGADQLSTERSYRLYLEELPILRPGEAAVSMMLRLGVPIFINPRKEQEGHQIVDVKLAEGTVLVSVKNTGNKHLLVNTIQAIGLDGANHSVFSKDAAGWYVLSGITGIFAVQLPEEGCQQSHKLQIAVKVTGKPGQDTMEATAPIDAKHCSTKNAKRTSLRP